MTFDHHGRVAFITGAGGGIGRATARRLAAEGAAVAVADLKEDAARETTSLIEKDSGRAVAFAADVRDRIEMTRVRDACLEEFGRVDYLVNNAGLVTMSSLDTLSDDEWDLVLDVNLKSMFIAAQLFGPSLAAADGRGAVVNLASIEGEVIVSTQGYCQPHYNASKGGVKMLTKALAVEFSRTGVRVNAVAPGPVDTKFIPDVDLHASDINAFLTDRLLIKRLAAPEEIAAAISFLLSDDASYITGSVLAVDGGWLTR